MKIQELARMTCNSVKQEMVDSYFSERIIKRLPIIARLLKDYPKDVIMDVTNRVLSIKRYTNDTRTEAEIYNDFSL